MALTRRQLVGGAAISVLGAGGIYKLVDELTAPPKRVASGALRPEQHLLDGIRIVSDNGVEVLVPPLHHQVVTATLRVGERPAELREAREELENALRRLDERFDPTPGGLGVTVAWGNPYFERYVPAQAERHLPVDRRATAARGEPRTGARGRDPVPERPRQRLGSRPNDVAVVLRSDSLEHIAEGATALFEDLDGLFRVTSIRKGFVGGGFEGGPGLPEADGARGPHPGCRAHPRRRAALPRIHLDPEGGPRPVEDREPRDARLRRPRAERLLRPGNAPAPLAPVRGPRGVVPGLRLPGARGHDLPARPRGPA